MKIGVIGSRAMVNGIAQVMEDAGHSIVLCDVNKEVLERAVKKFDTNTGQLYREWEKDLAAATKVLAKIELTSELNPLKDVDVVIEAIMEKMDVKKKIFIELAAYVKKRPFLLRILQDSVLRSLEHRQIEKIEQ